MSAEYEIVIGPGGTVTSELIKEAVNQDQACENIVRLMNSLGSVTEHDEKRGCPQPVNQGLYLPGTGGNGN
jgi:hypothetical protein